MSEIIKCGVPLCERPALVCANHFGSANDIIADLRNELTAVTLERDALAKALNPRLWTRAQSDAWHRAIPDLYKAFESLRSANSATGGQS